ncbi:MAG: peptidylprolyl isomerase [Gloeobacteraceae cyanobacterium ES-bin-316]|nr:peptidylprolyl isomerase [Ferruginibacter sp.]
MKKFYLLLVIAIGSNHAWSQTFITYGNNSISKQEFLKAYNKNKTQVEDKEKSLREYVELYSNFKLKVKAAEELRLDTLAQIQYDIRNFREQIMDNYLSDEKGIEGLSNEAFARSQKDLQVLHFSAKVNPAATPADTSKPYNAIMALYNSLKVGNSNNPAVDVEVVKQADLGFITAFTLPYEYENIIYGLKQGEISKPYRSKNAWHIFKVTGERPNPGKWRIAQVLVAVDPGANEAAKIAAQKKADEAYNLLVNGDSFSAIAKTYSDDKLTYLAGGELPEFGTGVYTANFENEVFKLKTHGAISKPFLTEFGYHIVKRMGHTPTAASPADEALMFDIKQKVMKDSRVNAAKEKYMQDMIAKVGTKRNNQVKDADLWRYADSIVNSAPTDEPRVFPISNKKVLRVKDEDLTGADWLAFVKDYKTNSAEYKQETNKQLWEKFVEVSALNYYKKHLEAYNPEFNFQMQEFKEGNMLFEIMERNVWGKAINDSVGLIKHYNTYPSNFKWAASADVLIFNCTTAKIADETMKALKKGKNWRSIAEEQSANAALQADSGRYEISQIVGANYASIPTAGTYTAIVTNIDGTATFVKYVKLYEANQQRSFEEARGLVINEYQQELEKQWLAELKKKYPVKVNEKMIPDML